MSHTKLKTVSDPAPSSPDSEPPLAPDGGWGWVVVFSSFFISFIVDGIGYSFGIIKPELDEHFHGSSKSTTAWAGSLLTGVYLIVGKSIYKLCVRELTG